MSIRPRRCPAPLATVLAVWALGSPAAARAGELHAAVRDAAGKGVADAVVVAVPGPGVAAAPRPPAHAIEDQIDKEFVPHVLAVPAGTAVSFPNNDDIRHHVYSFSAAKSFELPLYSGTPAKPVVFDKPGVVILGCNIHDWMIGYIYVSDSPYFATTGADGKAVLDGLPAGEYTVRVWHPRQVGKEEATAQAVVVPAQGAAATVREIGLTPNFRPRRAPLPGQGGY